MYSSVWHRHSDNNCHHDSHCYAADSLAQTSMVYLQHSAAARPVQLGCSPPSSTGCQIYPHSPVTKAQIHLSSPWATASGSLLSIPVYAIGSGGWAESGCSAVGAVFAPQTIVHLTSQGNLAGLVRDSIVVTLCYHSINSAGKWEFPNTCFLWVLKKPKMGCAGRGGKRE